MRRTRCGSVFRQREIVLLPVPLSNLSAAKPRPGLVLSRDDYNARTQDLLIAAVTSNIQDSPYGVTFSTLDLDDGQLPVESQVRLDKLYAVAQKNVLKRVGRLSKKKYGQALERLNALVKA